jgi:RecB family exonuclease
LGLTLTEPRPLAMPMPPPRLTSYRYWEDWQPEYLHAIHATLTRVIDEKERQGDLFTLPEEAAPAAAPPLVQHIPATQIPDTDTSEKNATLGAVLSPSQCNLFLGCSAKWWFRYGAGLPDPRGGALVRGSVVHKLAEYWFRQRLGGVTIETEDLAAIFDTIWDKQAEGAQFSKDEPADVVKKQAATLAKKYIDEAAPEINVVALEQKVSGEIAGVPVIGYIDMLDVDGRIIDLKTAKAKPSGIDPGYAFQLATYRQLEPRANGKARLDTVVATKTPQLVTISYEVSTADQLATQQLYPLVREGMREGLYFPNRGSNLCSRRYCNFCDACEKEYGGKVE